MVSLKKYFSSYEFRRKAAHIIGCLLVVILINIDMGIIYAYLNLILLGLILALIMMSMAVKYRLFRPIAILFEFFDKPKDFSRFPGKGGIYYLTGILITVLLFDRDIASASIIILALGDPAAHLIGKYYGKTKLIINKKKVLEGTLAGTVMGLLGALFFVPFHIAFIGAACGMAAETVELEYLNMDDNFVIPIVAGTVMQLTILLKI